MYKTALLLLMFAAANSFAAAAVSHKVDTSKLVATIDQRVEKYVISTSTEEGKEFSALVDDMTNDISSFSVTSKLSFDQVVIILGKVYEGKIKSLVAEVKRTKSSVVTEEYANNVLKLTNEQMAFMALTLVFVEHDVVPLTKGFNEEE